MTWVLRFLGACARQLWLLLAMIIIAYATIIVIGRELLPVIDRYQPQINRFLSDLTGVELRSDSLGGYWSRLTPVLKAEGIRILADEDAVDQPVITVDKVSAELDPLVSLSRLQPVWRELDVGSVTVTLTEDAAGHWTVGGLELAGESPGSLDGLVDMLFYSSHIRIDRVTVALQFFSGIQTRVYASEILVENSGDFHRATASVALEEASGDTARLVLEGTGDPHNFEKFDGKGYLKLRDVNFTGSLSALVQGWFPEMAARVGEIDTNLDAEFWFSSVKQGVAKLVGRIEAAEIPLNWAMDLPPLKNFHTELTGWYRPGVDWGVRFQGADADWAGADIDPLNAELVERVGERWTEFALRVDHLNLEVVQGLLGTAGLLNETMAGILGSLNPRGNIHNLHLAVDIGEKPPALQVRANLDGVAVDSFRGAPAARDVSGYVQVDGLSGFLELDSQSGFAMRYPQVYEDFMVYDRARGRIDWRVDMARSQVLVQSGPINIDNQDGRGKAYLNLMIPTAPGPDPEMTLMVGLRDSHSRYRNHYIPDILPPDLLDWLDSAIGDGEVPEAGFIWRGSLRKEHPERRTIQLYARVENGRLAFQDDWLPLENVDASLTLDDRRVDAWIDAATMGGGRVIEGTVALRPTPTDNLMLQVQATMEADAGAALEILRESPLADRVGLSTAWQLSGASSIRADLAIPLATEDQGLQAYRVSAGMSDSRFALRDTELVIEDIQGQLDFSLASGLSSDSLRGRFLGEPVTATVATDADATRVDFKGRVAVSAALNYLGPLAPRVDGETAYRGELAIPVAGAVPPVLTIESDLKGVSLDLPDHLAKAADKSWPTSMAIRFREDAQEISANVDNRFFTRLLLSADQPLRGTLGIGIAEPRVQDRPGLLVRGRLQSLDTAVWREFLAAPPMDSGSSDAAKPSEPKQATGFVDLLAPRFDMRIAELTVEGHELGNTRVQGGRGDAGWDLKLTSDVLAGAIRFDDGPGKPLKLRLQHLRLPRPEPVEGQPGTLDTLDPRSVPALDFATESFSLGDEEYGSLAFVSEPDDDGLRIGAIQGNIKGMVIGEEQERLPTLIQWRTDGSSHDTLVTGVVRTEDVGDLLELWGAPRVIDSENAAFSIDLTWPDKPWKVQPAGLQGYVGLNLEDGKFYKSPGGAANALIKLVGLFNFDTWLRRLRFDFSDFFSSGVSFDQIRGGLAFDNGIMAFDEPLQVDMTSGKMRLLGQADLINEEIDARLIATMPVGTNLPWVAALVGGLPAAAGVFLTSKLFKKEVDKLSSIRYRVTGAWDDPELKVDRIFSDDTDFTPAGQTEGEVTGDEAGIPALQPEPPGEP